MKIEAISVRGHYEIFVDGKFYCSADTQTEAAEEIEKLRFEK